uniref:Alpha,alpha-trehalose-phosphate synthase (UDP-forming) n=2 Tax=Compsopogon caeruleus TaxID=31354 RepID=A0A7S1T975_9RHOD
MEGKLTLKCVGILNTDEEIREDEKLEITRILEGEFHCSPVFLPQEMRDKFYQGFCKGILWPVFHMFQDATLEIGKTVEFDFDLWDVYNQVNEMFSEVVCSIYNPGDLIWVHDYHLLVLPGKLRDRAPLAGAKIGFFLHIPWPSSETYRSLPVRGEILRGVLSSTLVGFHLFDYARHFLSACRRLLSLDHSAHRGMLGVEYMGRHVLIRVSHIGIDPDRFARALKDDVVLKRSREMRLQYHGRWILGGVDDLDELKGISLKLLAFEELLKTSWIFREKLMLIQVAIPKKSRVSETTRDEISSLVDRINSTYGMNGRVPVVYIEQDITFSERVALYSIIDTLFLTPLRDGLNLVPYEYIISASEGKGQLVLSEFTGCSKALSAAIRVNPWDISDIASQIDKAFAMSREEITARHTSDSSYVSKHPTSTWAESFLSDLHQASEVTGKLVNLGYFLPSVRSVDLFGFERLNLETLRSSYTGSDKRLLLLDYDGTLTSNSESTRMSFAWAVPGTETMNSLQALASDERNTIFIVSGRTTEVLSKAFESISSIGLIAEHGLQIRYPGECWGPPPTDVDYSWLELAKEIMLRYCERTDGSYIEEKKSGIVWHLGDADPEFGNWQAKDLHGHLCNVLAGYEASVISGRGWLQVRSSMVSKGIITETILQRMSDGEPDFVFCVGDDQTDEDMFKCFGSWSSEKVFTCTVGVKPSNAKYYVRTNLDVSHALETLALGKRNSTESVTFS